MDAVSVVMRPTYGAGAGGTSAPGSDRGGVRPAASPPLLHPRVDDSGGRPSYACQVPDHAPADPPAVPLRRRLIGAVVDDRSRPDQHRFRLLLLALFMISALVGASPSSTADAIAYGALVIAAAAGWLIWTLLPDAEGRAQAGLALAAIAGAAIMLPSRDATGLAAAFAAVGVTSAVSRLPGPRAALVVLGVVVVFAIAVPVAGFHAAAFGLIFVAVGVPAGLVQREHRRRTEQTELLLAEAQRTREEQARAAVLAERVRLARDVHDVLAHTLAGLAIQLETAEALLADAGDPDRALDVIRRSRGLVVEGIDETRRAVSALRGDAPTRRARAGRRWSTAAGGQGADVSLDITGDPRGIAPDAAAGAGADRARGAHERPPPRARAARSSCGSRVGDEAVLTVRNAVPPDRRGHRARPRPDRAWRSGRRWSAAR